MSYIATFSDWTLAILPRLFLYPGGVFLLLLLLGLRFLADGKQSIHLAALLSDYSRANLPPLAVAWATFALLPLPGVQPLPFPIDKFVLAGLLAVSLLLDRLLIDGTLENKYAVSGIEIVILIAVVAPLAGQPSLLVGGNGIAGWLSLLAVGVGLIGLARHATHSLALSVRWVGWLGLAATPLWTLPGIKADLRAVLAYAILIAVLAFAGRVFSKTIRHWAIVATPILAALSLLIALLAGDR